MTVQSNNGLYTSDDRKLELFHNTREKPKQVRCIKDNPTMYGFGKVLHIGDIVTIKGTVCNDAGRFDVAVPAECAFYDYTAFEPTDEFFNVE